MPPHPTNWIQVTCETRSATFEFTTRDWKVLSAMHVSEADNWLSNFGFGKAGPVSVGLEIGYDVTGYRTRMLAATEALIKRLSSETDLLIFDYWVQRTPGTNGEPHINYFGGRMSGLLFQGKPFGLNMGPGQCRLIETTSGPDPISIDLREKKKFELDGTCSLTIGRRKRGLTWTTLLPTISAFLGNETSAKIKIHNHHR